MAMLNFKKRLRIGILDFTNGTCIRTRNRCGFLNHTNSPLKYTNLRPYKIESFQNTHSQSNWSHFTSRPGSKFPIQHHKQCVQDRSMSPLNKLTYESHNNLNILALNCQSIRESASLLHDRFTDDNIDIAVLTETWLKPEGDEAFITSLVGSEYKLFSFPRLSGKGYGGVGYVIKRELIPFVKCKRLHYQSMEAAELKITIGKLSSIFIVIYRLHPNKKLSWKTFFEEIPEMLSDYSSKNCDFHLHGDFNLHFNKPDSYYVSKLLTIFSDHDLVQKVNEPTQRCGNILDWTVIRSDSSLLEFNHVKKLPGISDHYGIYSSLNMIPPTPVKRIVLSRNLRDIDMNSFKNEVKISVDAICHENFTDVTELVDTMNTKIKYLLDQYAPLTTRSIRDRAPAPWKTEEVREVKRKARRAERKWRKSGLTVDEQIYRNELKNLQHFRNMTRKNYYSSEIESCNTSKQIFQISDKLLGKHKSSTLPNNVPRANLPQYFCNYFEEKIRDIRRELDRQTHDNDFSDTFTGIVFQNFKLVSNDELEKIILSMPTKSCSLDPLPTTLMKCLLPEFLPLLTEIINLSLKTGNVPTSFKEALIIPLLKKPNLDCDTLKNYRPVSNLPFLSKVLERVVLKQLLDHLTLNNLLETYQSAYRCNHSTETAVLDVVNNFFQQCDNHNITIASFLDLSSAFDTIDHDILLERLEKSYGICGMVLKWFTSYITDRFQFVSIDSKKSSPSKLEFGVPQGSVLGPVLFSLYTQSLSYEISKHNCQFHKYADDTEISNSTEAEAISYAKQELNNCFHDVSTWMSNNKLKLNPDKTEVLIVGTNHQLKELDTKDINLGQNTFCFQPCIKYLGFKLDSCLSMSDQINSVSRSCYFDLRRISSIRKYLTDDAVKTLVCARILSRLDYCNAVFTGMSTSNFNKLQTIQNAAAKMIFKKRKFDHASPLLKRLHWLPVRARCDYKISVLAYKYFEGSLPEYLSNTLIARSPSRNLRSSSEHFLQLPKINLKHFGERSFSFAAPRQWNSLPRYLRHACSLDAFKRNLKTYLFKKQFPE